MSANVILVAGLPGSGKTTHICKMFRDGWLVFDDFKANAIDNDKNFSRSRKFRSLIIALSDNLKCVVADIDFCDSASRDQADRILVAIFPHAKIEWHFFEKNPSACEANIRSRNNNVDEELGELRKYAVQYDVPHGATTLPVFMSINHSGAEAPELL